MPTNGQRFGGHRLMIGSASLYKGRPFPPDIIRYAMWLDFRTELGHRDSEG